MKYVLIDGFFSTLENVLTVHATLFSLLSVSSTDCVYSPTWPENSPVSGYESILIDLVCGLSEPAVFVTHSLGSLIFELCLLHKKIPIDKIKSVIHCSPHFRNKRRDEKILSILPSFHIPVPGILKRSMVTERFYFHSVWVKRNPTLYELKEINQLTVELTHLEKIDNLKRTFYMDRNDKFLSFEAQSRFLSRQGFFIIAKNATNNNHRHFWENQNWFNITKF